MALRELLSSSQRQAFEAIPLDRPNLIKHYILSDQDLSLIRRRRGAQNRLGLAVQLALLRFPGRALLPDETPPTELLAFLARQLRTPVTALASYAERDETRREHLAELQLHYGCSLSESGSTVRLARGSFQQPCRPIGVSSWSELRLRNCGADLSSFRDWQCWNDYVRKSSSVLNVSCLRLSRAI